jgi:hypothetical protein
MELFCFAAACLIGCRPAAKRVYKPRRCPSNFTIEFQSCQSPLVSAVSPAMRVLSGRPMDGLDHRDSKTRARRIFAQSREKVHVKFKLQHIAVSDPPHFSRRSMPRLRPDRG